MKWSVKSKSSTYGETACFAGITIFRTWAATFRASTLSSSRIHCCLLVATFFFRRLITTDYLEDTVVLSVFVGLRIVEDTGSMLRQNGGRPHCRLKLRKIAVQHERNNPI